MVSRYDENKNGVLEENEWKRMSGYHHQADTNGDKVITRDELVDRLAAFERYCDQHGDLSDLLAWANHPNRAGHELVARELLRWFPIA